MHLTAFLTVGFGYIIASVSAAAPIASTDDFSIHLPGGSTGWGTYIPPSKSVVVSYVRSLASAQVTESAFAAELSKIPQAKGHNIPSDMADVAAKAIYSFITTGYPAWMSAVPTNGAIAAALNSDIELGLKTRVEGATKVTGTGTAAAVAAATKDADAPLSAASTDKKADGTTTATKASGTETKTSSSAAKSTSNSKAAGASQPTGAVMAAGAAAVGILAVAVML